MLRVPQLDGPAAGALRLHMAEGAPPLHSEVVPAVGGQGGGEGERSGCAAHSAPGFAHHSVLLLLLQESRCRFCHSQLPDWRDAYAPPVEVTGGKLATTMTIHSGGRTHWVQVKPGAAGMDEVRARMLPPCWRACGWRGV